MRVPVLKTDLPEKFNKVAKYIGRHWPNGKLGLGQSRETTAFLFGYNSVHELNQTAPNNELPNSVNLREVIRSITGKAFVRYNVHPQAIKPILQKTPFKELAFYEVTDEYFFNQQSQKGSLIVHDEWQEYQSYKSPILVIQQHKAGLLPKYNYAVRADGYIFSSAKYESLVNSLGDFSQLFEDKDSFNEFQKGRLLENAWIPLKDYLSEKEREGVVRWNTPHMINVYHYKDDEGHSGYLLKHEGYDAFYPVMCLTIDDVNNCLTDIYMNRELQNTSIFLDKFKVAISFTSNVGDYEHWQSVRVADRNISLNGQEYFRVYEYVGYPELVKSEILQKLNIPKSGTWPLKMDVIDRAVYEQHLKVAVSVKQFHRDGTINPDARESFTHLFELAFFRTKVTLEKIYDEGDIDALEQYERKELIEDGEYALKHHKELRPFFDVIAIGFLWKSYMNYVEGEHYAMNCSEWNGGFVAYCFMQSDAFTTSRWRSEDDVVIGMLLLLHYSHKKEQSEPFSLIDMTGQANILLDMLNRFNTQQSGIEQMEKWASHFVNMDKQYVSHGTLVSYTQKSMNEGLREAVLAGRKYGVTFTPSN